MSFSTEFCFYFICFVSNIITLKYYNTEILSGFIKFSMQYSHLELLFGVPQNRNDGCMYEEINLRIIYKPHAFLRSLTKTPADKNT